MANKETGATGATVTTVVGQVFARNEAGEMREIKPGDVLHEGEKIVTSPGARAELDAAKMPQQAVALEATATLPGKAAEVAHSVPEKNGHGAEKNNTKSDTSAETVIKAKSDDLTHDTLRIDKEVQQSTTVNKAPTTVQYEQRTEAILTSLSHVSNILSEPTAQLARSEAATKAEPILNAETRSVEITNHAPVASNAIGATGENAILTTTVPLLASDTDGRVANYTLVRGLNPGEGQLTFNADGTYSFNPGSDFDTLAAGATQQISFSYAAVDDKGKASAPAMVTLTITGTNDAAVLSSATANLTETNAALTTSGTLTISDVDSAQTFVAQAGTAGTYGTFVMNTAGVWSYTASSAHNEFVAGTTYTDTFTVSAADGTTSNVTVNITGTNDAAVLSSATANLTETNAALTTGGTLTISDVDSSQTYVAQAGTAGTYGTLTLATNGVWSYTASSAHNEFVAGTTYTDTFTVTSADGTTSSITVNITGTNDAAVLSSPTANLTETNAVLSTGGTLTISDTDSAQTFVAQASTAGTYGTFVMNTAGVWSYTASNAHNEFAAGTTYTDSFTVTSADGTTSSVTVNITGTNDAATLSSATASLTETNAVLSTSGTLTISDVDSSQTYVAQAGTAGTYGTFVMSTAGVWSYTASTAHNEFAVGTTYTDTFTVTSADGTTSNVTVNITGTNDAPTVTADTATASIVNGTNSSSINVNPTGNVLNNDADPEGDSTTVSAISFGGTTGTVGNALTGSYGSLTMNSDGSYTYTVDHSNATVQALRYASSPLTETFTYTARDALGVTSNSTLTVSVRNAPTLTFGDGTKTINVSSTSEYGDSMALTSDGKIVLAGRTGGGSASFGLVRMNADGSLDSSFGTGGIKTVGAGTGGICYKVSMALASDNTMVLTADNYMDGTYTTVTRLNANGTAMTSFDSDGSVLVASGGAPAGVAFDANGQIVLAGDLYSNWLHDTTATRLNTNGSLDTSFDTDGKVRVEGSGSGSNDAAGTLLLNADGSMFLGGYAYQNNSTTNDFLIVKLTSTGAIDTSFGTNGITLTNFGGVGQDNITQLLTQSDGKLVAVGRGGSYYYGDFAIARYTTSGALDTSFGTGGKVQVNMGGGTIDDGANCVVQQADGKFLVAGYSVNASGNTDFAIVRLTTNGSVDTSFGVSGKVIIDFAGGDDSVTGMMLQNLGTVSDPDYRILLTGYATTSGNRDYAVARLNMDGTLDKSFDPANTAAFTEAANGAGGASVVLSASATLNDMTMNAAGNYNGCTLTLNRQGGANTDDAFSAKTSGTLSALTESGNLVVGGVTIGTVTTNHGGTLLLTFNSNATQTLVNSAIQQIAYINNSDTPASSVTINWAFNDGASDNSGIVNTTTTVNITAANDAPVVPETSLSVNENASALTGNILTNAQDGESQAMTVSGVVFDGTTYAAGATVTGVYGTLVVSSNGAYTYTVDSAHANTNGLFSGQVATDDFSIRTTDGSAVGVSGLAINVTGTGETLSAAIDGDGSANTLTGDANSRVISGLGGDDSITGGSSNESILGGSGNDSIDGGGGNDLINSGSGNDMLTGGTGADTFQWSNSDAGSAGSPATDTISDFSNSSRNAGGDVLDLKDLLQGESHSGHTAGTLANYLHFEHSGSDTIVHVSTTGAYSGGFNAAQDDQRINLTAVDLVGAFTTDAQVINDLLTRGKLVTD